MLWEVQLSFFKYLANCFISGMLLAIVAMSRHICVKNGIFVF